MNSTDIYEAVAGEAQALERIAGRAAAALEAAKRDATAAYEAFAEDPTPANRAADDAATRCLGRLRVVARATESARIIVGSLQRELAAGTGK